MKFTKLKKTFIVAEISGNHNGDISRAKKMILAADKCGADAVKIQSYTPDSITLNSYKRDFQQKHLSKDSPWKKYKNFFEIYKKAQTPIEFTKKLFNFAKKKNIKLFSSPFDINTVQELKKLNCPIFKIASPEITHIPLIQFIAKTKKPVILSTGVSTLKDIDLAIKTLKKGGCRNIAILKCDSSYPSSLIDSNLKNIISLKKKFNLPIGFSDHTKGDIASIVAVSLGAKIIEKHFNLDDKKTVDSFFSLNPKEFKLMVYKIRQVELCKGSKNYKISKSSRKNFVAKRSIYISKKINKGEIINENNIKVVRPSFSIHPKYYSKMLGKKAKRNFNYASRIKLKDLN